MTPIFSHGAQFTNPRREPKYWKEWHDFEVAHGNEDTFRDMLRIKRSVQVRRTLRGYFQIFSEPCKRLGGYLGSRSIRLSNPFTRIQNGLGKTL